MKKSDQQNIIALYESSQQQEPEMEVDKYGTKRWYLNRKLHREGGPAIIYADNTKVWYNNGFVHREGGPAIEYPGGTASWYYKGQRHRLDGPADTYGKRIDWYVDGILYKDIYKWAKAALEYQNLPDDENAVKQYAQRALSNQTDEEI